MPFCTECGKKIGLFIHKHRSDEGWRICDSCFDNIQNGQKERGEGEENSNLKEDDYELDLNNMFKRLGYEILDIPTSEYHGVDFILSKNEEKIVVQVKQFDDKITDFSVHEILTAKEYYKADKARIITNSSFSSNAVDLAVRNNVDLWDGKKLRDIIKILQNKEKEKKLGQKDSPPHMENNISKEIITNCPFCSKEFTVEINVGETGVFKVKCPYCGGVSKGNFGK
jgi:hypothetical protein